MLTVMIIKKIRYFFCFAFLLFISATFFSCSKPGDAKVEQAVTSYSAGKYDEALKLFKESLNEERCYSDELIYNFISTIYSAQSDFENAAIWMEKSLEKKSDYRGYITLGMNYQSLKDYEKAEENYLKAAQLDETRGEAWASLGMMYIEEEKSLEKAALYLEKGVEFSPSIAVIHAYLAVAYYKLGNKEKSYLEFEKAKDLKCENLDLIKEKFNCE